MSPSGLGRVKTLSLRRRVEHVASSGSGVSPHQVPRDNDVRFAALCLDCLDQPARPHDIHDPGEIVGEHVQGHLGANARQCLH